jgi:hypothetical protein
MTRCFVFLRHLLCLAFVGIFPSLASAAFITDVTDSFDYENNRPFGFRLFISYEFQYTSATIAREHCRVTDDKAYARSCTTPPIPPNSDRYFSYAPEFDLSRVQHAMMLRPAIGLYKDLELYANIPLIFSENFSIRTNTNDVRFSNATLVKEGIVPDSTLNNGEATSRHGFGLGDLSIGLRWGVFNDVRDRGKASWVLGFEWTLPTGEVWAPGDPRAFTQAGGAGVGRGAHILHFNVSLSRRISVFDPYVQIWYKLYLVPEDVKQGLQRFSTGSEAQTPRVVQDALAPGHHGGILFGSEFVLWEHRGREQKLAFDLRFMTTARFEGRDYNMFTDFLVGYQPRAGDTFIRQSLITDHEQFFSFGGMAAFLFRLNRYGLIRIEGRVEYTSPFFITYAKRGVDRNNNGFVDPGTDEEYPYFVPQLDGIGRRIQQRDTLNWGIMITAALTI